MPHENPSNPYAEPDLEEDIFRGITPVNMRNELENIE